MNACAPPNHSWHFINPRPGERTYCNCGETVARYSQSSEGGWVIMLDEPSQGELFGGRGEMGRGDELHLTMSTEFLRQRLDTWVQVQAPGSGSPS